MKTFMLVTLLFISGCSPTPLTDSQVATMIASCERQGLMARLVTLPLNNTVECVVRPKVDNKSTELKV